MHVEKCSFCCFILFGFCTSVTLAKGWGKWKKPFNQMCPSEDPQTHECYEMTTENSTCMVYTISCNPNYDGVCFYLQFNVEVRACTVYTCSHDGCCEGYVENEWGTCVEESSKTKWFCKNGGYWHEDACNCLANFKGKYCEIPICDEPCLNGGKCEISDGQPTCICRSSLNTGKQCEIAVCQDGCMNGGVCVQDGVSARCKCPIGYRGDQCQYSMDPRCPAFSDKQSLGECDATPGECITDTDCNILRTSENCCYDGCRSVCTPPKEGSTCNFNGREYGAGSIFTLDTDACQRCVCQPWGSVTCTNLTCTPRQCPGGHTPVTVEGHCCQMCPGDDIDNVPIPYFTNCPTRFITVDTSEFDDSAFLPDLQLDARDFNGDRLAVTYSMQRFFHSHCTEVNKNMHFVTVSSEADIYGRRTECVFTVIVRDPFLPLFKSCPAEIYALNDETITWQDPSVADNVGVYRIKADGDEIRGQVLDVGTYPVSYTVWDYDQNQAICAFMVRVFDTSIKDRDMPAKLAKRRNAVSTIVAVLVSLLLLFAFFLSIALIARRYTRRGTTAPQHGDNHHTRSNNIFSISASAPYYENSKIPNLPDYSPPMHPPSYEEIEHDYEIPGNIEPPIYEEIATKPRDDHDYENIDSTCKKEKHDSATMEYMKI